MQEVDIVSSFLELSVPDTDESSRDQRAEVQVLWDQILAHSFIVGDEYVLDVSGWSRASSRASASSYSQTSRTNAEEGRRRATQKTVVEDEDIATVLKEAVRLGKNGGLQDMKAGDLIGVLSPSDTPSMLQTRPRLGILTFLEAIYGISTKRKGDVLSEDRLFVGVSVEGGVGLSKGAYIPLDFWEKGVLGVETPARDAFVQISVGVFPVDKPKGHTSKLEAALTAAQTKQTMTPESTFGDAVCGRHLKAYKSFRKNNPALLAPSMLKTLQTLVHNGHAVEMACGCIAVAVVVFRPGGNLPRTAVSTTAAPLTVFSQRFVHLYRTVQPDRRLVSLARTLWKGQIAPDVEVYKAETLVPILGEWKSGLATAGLSTQMADLVLDAVTAQTSPLLHPSAAVLLQQVRFQDKKLGPVELALSELHYALERRGHQSHFHKAEEEHQAFLAAPLEDVARVSLEEVRPRLGRRPGDQAGKALAWTSPAGRPSSGTSGMIPGKDTGVVFAFSLEGARAILDSYARVDRPFGIRVDATHGVSSDGTFLITAALVDAEFAVVPLGCGFTRTQRACDFAHVLGVALGDFQPQFAISDMDPAIACALADLFPGIEHRDCIFHIFQIFQSLWPKAGAKPLVQALHAAPSVSAFDAMLSAAFEALSRVHQAERGIGQSRVEDGQAEGRGEGVEWRHERGRMEAMKEGRADVVRSLDFGSLATRVAAGDYDLDDIPDELLEDDVDVVGRSGNDDKGVMSGGKMEEEEEEEEDGGGGVPVASVCAGDVLTTTQAYMEEVVDDALDRLERGLEDSMDAGYVAAPELELRVGRSSSGGSSWPSSEEYDRMESEARTFRDCAAIDALSRALLRVAEKSVGKEDKTTRACLAALNPDPAPDPKAGTSSPGSLGSTAREASSRLVGVLEFLFATLGSPRRTQLGKYLARYAKRKRRWVRIFYRGPSKGSRADSELESHHNYLKTVEGVGKGIKRLDRVVRRLIRVHYSLQEAHRLRAIKGFLRQRGLLFHFGGEAMKQFILMAHQRAPVTTRMGPDGDVVHLSGQDAAGKLYLPRVPPKVAPPEVWGEPLMAALAVGGASFAHALRVACALGKALKWRTSYSVFRVDLDREHGRLSDGIVFGVIAVDGRPGSVYTVDLEARSDDDDRRLCTCREGLDQRTLCLHACIALLAAADDCLEAESSLQAKVSYLVAKLRVYLSTHPLVTNTDIMGLDPTISLARRSFRLHADIVPDVLDNVLGVPFVSSASSTWGRYALSRAAEDTAEKEEAPPTMPSSSTPPSPSALSGADPAPDPSADPIAAFLAQTAREEAARCPFRKLTNANAMQLFNRIRLAIQEPDSLKFMYDQYGAASTAVPHLLDAGLSFEATVTRLLSEANLWAERGARGRRGPTANNNTGRRKRQKRDQHGRWSKKGK